VGDKDEECANTSEGLDGVDQRKRLVDVCALDQQVDVRSAHCGNSRHMSKREENPQSCAETLARCSGRTHVDEIAGGEGEDHGPPLDREPLGRVLKVQNRRTALVHPLCGCVVERVRVRSVNALGRGREGERKGSVRAMDRLRGVMMP
jgi:hypothetical protein